MNTPKTMSLVRRQNSFGRDLSDLQSNTPTFCTLPRDSKACEEPHSSAFVPINSSSRQGIAKSFDTR